MYSGKRTMRNSPRRRTWLAAALAVLTAMLSLQSLRSQDPLAVPSADAPGAAGVPFDGRREFQLPVGGGQPAGDVRIDGSGGRVSVIVREGTLKQVLSELADSQGMNIVCADDVNANISITLRNVPIEEALTAMVSIAGCTWTQRGSIVHVSSLGSTIKLAPEVQGRLLRVFHLDYAAAADLDLTVKGLLSPVGSSYVMSRAAGDRHKTIESIVVEDLPHYLPRIEQYILQTDIPPRQVLIEVHVLQVELENDNRHGINFEHVMNFAGHSAKIQLKGMANAGAPQAFMAELQGGNLTALIEALKTTTDAKTLASPRVLALNGQLSRIQVGEQLGYRVTTTTQTSTLESVEFLKVGVVLDVTPTISRDNHVLLDIMPKVSTGAVNPDTGLPEEATSEVQTSVLLRDGEGIVIGGLIQEADSNTQSKVYHLGEMRGIGALFSRRQLIKDRNEIIFFLVPRIVPYHPSYLCYERMNAERAMTPLFHGPLHRNLRPWEPSLNDCFSNPALFRLPPIASRQFPGNHHEVPMHPGQQHVPMPVYQELRGPEEIPLGPAIRDARLQRIPPVTFSRRPGSSRATHRY